MKLHAYEGEEVEEITLDSSKSEVCSAVREFFQPIAFVTKAVVSGGEHFLDALRRRTMRSGRAKKGDSAAG